MTWSRRALLVVAALCATACLGYRGLVRPSAGGDQWLQLGSKHFKVFTDLEDAEARRTVAELERVCALLESAWLGDASSSLHTLVVVFRTRGEALEFFPGYAGGRYVTRLPNELEPTPTLLTYGELSLLGRITLAHELTHRLTHQVLGPVSTWLNEGLAQYYSTIAGDPENPIVGEPDPEHVVAAGSVRSTPGYVIFQGLSLPTSRLPKASDLVQFGHTEFYAQPTKEGAPPDQEAVLEMARNYAASWMLLHMLLHEESRYAMEFRHAFDRRNQVERSGAILDQILRDVPKDVLDRDFAEYLNRAIRWRQRHRPAAPPLRELDLHALSEPETLLLWARLDDFKGPHRARAKQRLDAAHRAAPNHPETQFWLGRWHARQQAARTAAEHYEAALRTKPREPRYLLALASVYSYGASDGTWPDQEREDRLGQVMTLLQQTASTAQQLNAVATYKLGREDYSAAAEFSRRAREAEPGCWGCYHTSAAAAFMAGNAEQAVELERGALSRLPEGAPPEVVELVEKTLARYRSPAPSEGGKKQLPPLIMPE
jgi:hypothetical protein